MDRSLEETLVEDNYMFSGDTDSLYFVLFFGLHNV